MWSLDATCHDRVAIIILLIVSGSTAVLLGEVGSLSSEKLSGKVLRRVLVIVGGAALAGFAVFELSMCWEEPLVVGRSGEGLLASSL
jgi:hypothetical protein